MIFNPVRGVGLVLRGGPWSEPIAKATTSPIFKAVAEPGDAEILKFDADDSEHYTLGIVLEPLKELCRKDSQKDFYSAAEVRKAAHYWMEQQHDIGKQHTDIVTGKVKVLENWICHEDTTIGTRKVTKGTWLLGVRVLDEHIWKDIKDRKITGFSIGGWATRTPVNY